MPYFKVRLSGAGISYPFADGSDPVIGFFTTRVVKAPDLGQAQAAATSLVLSEWLPGGPYAADNAGSPPTLSIEEAWPIGLFSGFFGAAPDGYTFYTHDD
ncbi:hypothetical protein [Lysobacter sp. FW306-1B-D06B]|uniref:hypothetical protein n=1 Tax=Lysobacter sp. FW306-1B-D06B TaxID=3140250 RepID=UPI003140AB5B